MNDLLSNNDRVGLALMVASAVAVALRFARLERIPLVLMAAIVVVGTLVSAFAFEPPVDHEVDLTSFQFANSLSRRICAGLSILLVAAPLGKLALPTKKGFALGLVTLGPFAVGLTLSGFLLLTTLLEIMREQPGREVAVERIAGMIGRTNVLLGVLTAVSGALCLWLAASLHSRSERSPR